MATEQVVLNFSPGPHTVAVKANGGSVAVEKQVGNDWVAADVFTTDGAWRLDFGSSPTRITPSGGAAYQVSS